MSATSAVVMTHCGHELTPAFGYTGPPLRRLDPRPLRAMVADYWPAGHNRTERIMTETPSHRHATEPELADLLATEQTHQDTVLIVLDGLRDFGVALESLVTVRVDEDDNPVCVEQPLDPQTPGTITGYRQQSPLAIETVNSIKNTENAIGELIDSIREASTQGVLSVDLTMLSDSVKHLQTGYMWLVRSIFQPESRLKP